MRSWRSHRERGDTTSTKLGSIAMTTAALHTSGDIARMLGRNVQAVRHILNTRQHITERAKAGIVKLYDDVAVEAVRVELVRIDQRRGTVPAA